MKEILLNCTNKSFCEINKTEQPIFDNVIYILLISIPGLGVMFNSISAFILTFSQNSNSKYLKFLKYYSYNSLAISFIDCLFFPSHLYSVRSVYRFNQKSHFVYESSVINYIVYINTWVFLYTFSGILDIFIVYERIQIYLPYLKFLRNKTAGIISLGVLLYSFAINIPVGMARTTYHNRISIESEEPIDIYSYGLRIFKYNDIFLLSVFISNFIRDIISFLIEVILNIIR